VIAELEPEKGPNIVVTAAAAFVVFAIGTVFGFLISKRKKNN
jgi:hypothetical protein